MERWIDGWTDGWMDGWTNGWMDGWMDRKIKRLASRFIYMCVYLSIYLSIYLSMYVYNIYIYACHIRTHPSLTIEARRMEATPPKRLASMEDWSLLILGRAGGVGRLPQGSKGPNNSELGFRIVVMPLRLRG